MEKILKDLAKEIAFVDKNWQNYYDKLEQDNFIESEDDMISRLIAEGYSDGLKTAYLIVSGKPYNS